jgi:hypothetical protein
VIPRFLITTLLFLTWGTLGAANDLKVQLKLGIPSDFLPHMNGVEVIAELKSASSETLFQGRAGLTTNNRNIVATIHLIGVPDGVTALCYELFPKEIGAKWLVHRQCDGIKLQVTSNLVYTDVRGLTTRAEYLSLERNELSQRIRNSTSSDIALAERDREVSGYLKAAPVDSLGRLDARLVAELVNAAVSKVGTRVPSQDYFSLASPTSDIGHKLHEIVVNDRSTNGNTNAAKELFQSFTRIDFEQYSRGRDSFAREYFATLQFLASERSIIARENGLSGDTTAKEFAEFCKNLSSEHLISECLASLTEINDILLAEAASTFEDGSSADLQIALRYQIDAVSSIAGFLDGGTSRLNSEEMDRILSTRDTYRSIVCGSSANCIVP